MAKPQNTEAGLDVIYRAESAPAEPQPPLEPPDVEPAALPDAFEEELPFSD